MARGGSCIQGARDPILALQQPTAAFAETALLRAMLHGLPRGLFYPYRLMGHFGLPFGLAGCEPVPKRLRFQTRLSTQS